MEKRVIQNVDGNGMTHTVVELYLKNGKRFRGVAVQHACDDADAEFGERIATLKALRKMKKSSMQYYKEDLDYILDSVHEMLAFGEKVNKRYMAAKTEYEDIDAEIKSLVKGEN